MDTQQILDTAISRKASDIHIVAGTPVTLRVQGTIVAVENTPVLTAEMCESLVLPLMTPTQKEMFTNNKEIDFSYENKDGTRFRINAYYQQAKISAALRLLNNEIVTLEQLKLPTIMNQITHLKQGLILVTGPTGSGKSTTLAAMIESINQSRPEHIITIEDPIEYVYKPKQCLISQRELHQDTHSWDMALKSVLREDPDIVLVGEMRDYDTIASALTIAETGHLVFATLHTNSAAQTVDRIIDVFPENQQPQVRNQLASSLEAVFAQRLVPTVENKRIPCVEIMLASPAIRNTIREGKTHQIDNIIQTSGTLGMMSFESSLVYWVKAGVISMEKGKEYALRPEEFVRAFKT